MKPRRPGRARMKPAVTVRISEDLMGRIHAIARGRTLRYCAEAAIEEWIKKQEEWMIPNGG